MICETENVRTVLQSNTERVPGNDVHTIDADKCAVLIIALMREDRTGGINVVRRFYVDPCTVAINACFNVEVQGGILIWELPPYVINKYDRSFLMRIN